MKKPKMKWVIGGVVIILLAVWVFTPIRMSLAKNTANRFAQNELAEFDVGEMTNSGRVWQSLGLTRIKIDYTFAFMYTSDALVSTTVVVDPWLPWRIKLAVVHDADYNILYSKGGK